MNNMKLDIIGGLVGRFRDEHMQMLKKNTKEIRESNS